MKKIAKQKKTRNLERERTTLLKKIRASVSPKLLHQVNYAASIYAESPRDVSEKISHTGTADADFQ